MVPQHLIGVWRKSRRSENGNSNCVEVMFTEITVLVRDSKAPSAGMLDVSPGCWVAFLHEVKTGGFRRISS